MAHKRQHRTSKGHGVRAKARSCGLQDWGEEHGFSATVPQQPQCVAATWEGSIPQTEEMGSGVRILDSEEAVCLFKIVIHERQRERFHPGFAPQVFTCSGSRPPA